MGQGLQRAHAAAIRTQLTEEHFAFLRRLAELESKGIHATRQWLPLADRKQDRIRQKCCKAGVAKWCFGYWQLTKEGAALLATLPK